MPRGSTWIGYCVNKMGDTTEQRGRGDQADIEELFSRRVNLSPRPGWRSVHLSWSCGGTYTDHVGLTGYQMMNRAIMR